MAEYAGSALHVNWIYPSGTVTLSGDFTTFSSAPAVALYETTAGADTDRTYISGVKDRSISMTTLAQADGTALYTAVREGVVGTLIIGPEGTATGKPRETYPAISQGATRNQPFDNRVEYAISFQGNGTPTDDNY